MNTGATPVAGRRVAWAGPDGTVRVWDVRTGREGPGFRSSHSLVVPGFGSYNRVDGVAFSADGSTFTFSAQRST